MSDPRFQDPIYSAGYVDGITDEQQRIIKLLETDMEYAFGDDGECVYTKHMREVCNCDVIALIKGDNK